MPKTKVKVGYVNAQHDINPDLDAEIEKFFKGLGFTWAGSGIFLVKPWTRELSFEKEQKN